MLYYVIVIIFVDGIEKMLQIKKKKYKKRRKKEKKKEKKVYFQIITN